MSIKEMISVCILYYFFIGLCWLCLQFGRWLERRSRKRRDLEKVQMQNNKIDEQERKRKEIR